MMRSAPKFAFAVAWFVGVAWGLGVLASARGATPAESQVLYLHTEFLPFQRPVENGRPCRLGREIVRQAILLAAREELGLLTRDETLQESLPPAAHVTRVMPIERADTAGKWRVKLAALDDSGASWETTYAYVQDARKPYGDMLVQLEVDSRGALLEGLRAVGLQGAKRPPQDGPSPGPEIEALLGRVDCVAQFGAVRAAHAAMAAHGETPEWLCVLVRGYANLALLTRHYWNAAPEAFTARAWLYAQRLAASSQSSDLALWHRAYAWAWGGVFGCALADVAELEQRQSQASVSAATPVPPSWSKLIKAYCQCDRVALQQVGLDDPASAAWAAMLRFQLACFSQQQNWMLADAQEIKDLCPTAYGVYSDLWCGYRPTDLNRLSLTWVPPIFARCVPESLAALDSLPASVQRLVASGCAQNEPSPDPPAAGASTEPFSPLPAQLARQLRAESEAEAAAEPSWSMLAYLLEEEQFLQVLHHVLEAWNHGASSRAGDVERLLPLIQNHRYAMFVEGFRHRITESPTVAVDAWSPLVVADPRMNMYVMMRILWDVSRRDGLSVGRAAYLASDRTPTIQGMLEYVNLLTDVAPPPDAGMASILINELRAIAPHAAGADYLEVLWTQDPGAEQLQAWEAQLKQDPRAWHALAGQYAKRGEDASAQRCYERSLAMSPTARTAVTLAERQRRQGRTDQWEQTLLGFLEKGELDAERSCVQTALAEGYIERGQWEKARAHADALAEFGTTRELLLVSKIYEGLGDWPASEHWIRTASERYPTHAAHYWFFWCQRTGRGDVEAARDLAQKHVVAHNRSTLQGVLNDAVFRLCDRELRAALDLYRRALAMEPAFSSTFMVAQLARALKDENLRSEVLHAMQRQVAARAPDEKADQRPATAASLAILQLLQTGDASPQRLAQIDTLLWTTDPPTRCALAYYLGRELDALGQPAAAETYWRRALNAAECDVQISTLAGFELARRYGTSRPDDDPLDEADVWSAPPAADSH